MDAKERGISHLDGLRLESRAIPRTMGRKMATAAVLLMKADIAPTPIIMDMRARSLFFLPMVPNSAPIKFRDPVLNKPALRMNMAATVTVATLLKPEIPSAGEIIPVTNRAPIIIRATKSTDIHSATNRKMATKTRKRTRAISTVISDFLLSGNRGILDLMVPEEE